MKKYIRISIISLVVTFAGCASVPSAEKLNSIRIGATRSEVSNLLGTWAKGKGELGYFVDCYAHYPYGVDWGTVDTYFFGVFHDDKLIGFYNEPQYRNWYWNTFYSINLAGVSKNQASELLGTPQIFVEWYGYEVTAYNIGPFTVERADVYVVFKDGSLHSFYAKQDDFMAWVWARFWEVYQEPSTLEATREMMKIQFEQYQENQRLAQQQRQEDRRSLLSALMVQNAIEQGSNNISSAIAKSSSN